MHILACLLLFVFGSIAAACKGDFSGLEALGKGIGFLVLLFVMLWLFTQPVLLVIVIIILGSAGFALSRSSKTDIIVAYFLENKIYDMFEINDVLDAYGEAVFRL